MLNQYDQLATTLKHVPEISPHHPLVKSATGRMSEKGLADEVMDVA